MPIPPNNYSLSLSKDTIYMGTIGGAMPESLDAIPIVINPVLGMDWDNQNQNYFRNVLGNVVKGDSPSYKPGNVKVTFNVVGIKWYGRSSSVDADSAGKAVLQLGEWLDENDDIYIIDGAGAAKIGYSTSTNKSYLSVDAAGDPYTIYPIVVGKIAKLDDNFLVYGNQPLKLSFDFKITDYVSWANPSGDTKVEDIDVSSLYGIEIWQVS